MDGFIFLDKQEGVTSSKEDVQIKKLFNTRKVGHVGTLDPFATGLLIIGVNKGTKAIPFIDDDSKEYVATLTLGVETDSMDKTGKIIKEEKVPNLSKDKVNDVLHSFIGKSQQLTPMTSAVHVNGQKLYKLAHQGIEIDRPLRNIEVFEIELLSFKGNEIVFRVVVSKGTYVRVLGSDIAKKLGTVGHLSSLKRTKVGPYSIDVASRIEDITESSLVSTFDVLKKTSSVVKFDNKKIEDVKNGTIKSLEGEYPCDRLLVVNTSNEVVAMYVKNGNNKYQFVRGLF